jgi:hypothetical protein
MMNSNVANKQLNVIKPDGKSKSENMKKIKEMRSELLAEFYSEMKTTADRLKTKFVFCFNIFNDLTDRTVTYKFHEIL